MSKRVKYKIIRTISTDLYMADVSEFTPVILNSEFNCCFIIYTSLCRQYHSMKTSKFEIIR